MVKQKAKAGKQLSIPVEKKKGVKKVEPLIDGKYKQKFLVRLTPDEDKTFQEVIKITGSKTMTGALVKVISEYKWMKDKIQKDEEKILLMAKDNSSLSEMLDNLRIAFKAIL